MKKQLFQYPIFFRSEEARNHARKVLDAFEDMPDPAPDELARLRNIEEAARWASKGEHHSACLTRKCVHGAYDHGKQCSCYVGACRAALEK